MLFEGTRRDGFRPLRPEIKANEPTVIATRATIRNAKSAGIPKRRRAKLIATKMRVRPIGRNMSPTPTFVRLEEIEAPLSRNSARRSASSTCTNERVCSASSPRSSSVGRTGAAHLANQQPYQARNSDGSPRILLNPSLDIALHRGEPVLSGRGGLRQAIAGSIDDAGHLVPRRSDLFLGEIRDRLSQLCDVLAQTGHVGNRAGIRHFLRGILRTAPC